MEYPQEILPNKNLVCPFPLCTLVDRMGDYEVCYRLNGSIYANKDIDGLGGKPVLKEECFEHIAHLSMNLLGGLFRPEYICFVQKKPGCEPWCGENIKYEDYAPYVNEIADAVPIFYLASKINQKNLAVTVMFNDSQSYKMFKEKVEGAWPEFHKGISIEITSEMRIEHAPSNLNYWHLQMEVYPEMSEESLNNENGVWRSRIFEQIKTAVLCHHFTETPSLSYTIPEELYVKPEENHNLSFCQ